MSSVVAGNYVVDASYFGSSTGTARGFVLLARLAVYKVSWFGKGL